MPRPTSHTLDVPGARLYYEVQGSGPPLMLIGHPMDASGFATIAPVLAESYTVVTYDPRGFGRSTIDDPDQDGEPDLLADDVAGCSKRPSARCPPTSSGVVAARSRGSLWSPAPPATSRPSSPTRRHSPCSCQRPSRRGRDSTRSTTRSREQGIGAAWEAFSYLHGPDHGPARTHPPIRSHPRPRRWRRARASSSTASCPSPCTNPTSRPWRRRRPGSSWREGTASRGEFPQRTAVALAETPGHAAAGLPRGPRRAS